MRRWLPIMFLSTCFLSTGCVGRLIRESIGVVKGAAGAVVEIKEPKDLSHYKGLRVDPVTVTPGMKVADETTGLIERQWTKCGPKLQLTPDGEPKLVLRGEIIHYEMGGAVDQAIGPLQEIILRAKLLDAATGELLGEANLLGRAKATTESGRPKLAVGTAKAVRKWLSAHGLKEPKNDGDKSDSDEADEESDEKSE